MKYNREIAASLFNIFSIDVRVRTTKIAKLHKDQRGADLAYVDVKVGLAADETIELCELPIIAKTSGRVNPSTGEVTGRWVEIPTRVGSDGKRRPNFVLANELRAVITYAVFKNTDIAALAEGYESKFTSENKQEDELTKLRAEKAAMEARLKSLLNGKQDLEIEDDLEEDNPFE